MKLNEVHNVLEIILSKIPTAKLQKLTHVTTVTNKGKENPDDFDTKNSIYVIHFSLDSPMTIISYICDKHAKVILDTQIFEEMDIKRFVVDK